MTSFMFEIYYKAPVSSEREEAIASALKPFGGRLDCHEYSGGSDGPVILTYEFGSLEQANAGAEVVRALGEHVEGPGPYG